MTASDVAVRDETYIEDTALIRGKARDWLLEPTREPNLLAFDQRSEFEQRALVQRASERAREIVIACCTAVAAEGRQSFSGSIQRIVVNDKGIELKVMLSKAEENLRALPELYGKQILLVIDDAERFMGETPAKIIPQEPELPIGAQRQDEPGASSPEQEEFQRRIAPKLDGEKIPVPQTKGTKGHIEGALILCKIEGERWIGHADFQVFKGASLIFEYGGPLTDDEYNLAVESREQALLQAISRFQRGMAIATTGEIWGDAGPKLKNALKEALAWAAALLEEHAPKKPPEEEGDPSPV